MSTRLFPNVRIRLIVGGGIAATCLVCLAIFTSVDGGTWAPVFLCSAPVIVLLLADWGIRAGFREGLAEGDLTSRLGGSVSDLKSHLHRLQGLDFSQPIGVPSSDNDSLLAAIGRAQTQLMETLRQHALRNQLLTDILNTAPISFTLSTMQGHYEMRNQVFFNYFRIDPDGKAVTQSLGVYAQPSRRDALLAVLARDKVVKNEEVEFVRTDDSHFWGLISLSYVTQGDSTLLCGWTIDITERKSAQDALKESKDKAESFSLVLRERDTLMSAILQTSPVGFCLTERESGQYRMRNYTFMSYFGMDPNSSNGSNSLGVCVQPGMRNHLMQKLEHDGVVINEEVELRRVNGDKFWGLLYLSHVIHDQNQLVCGWLIDISTQKQAQLALENSKTQAEEATRIKSDFLANMSHEIRTPMNAIIGLSGLALKNEMPARIRDYLSKIQQSGEHLLRIINDILDYSKIESGKLEIESVPFELETVIDNVINLVSEKAESKNLELLCSIDSAVPRHLIGDPLRIGQILINYANNAVKFTDHGELLINIRVQETTASEVLLHFSLRDTGIGLTQEQMGRLFKSFVQADSSITRHYGGTGLGLAISKSLAHSMGGEVGLQSEFGNGSTFWFTARLKVASAEKFISRPSVDLISGSLLVNTMMQLAGHAPREVQDMRHAQGFSSAEAALAPLAGARILLVEDNEINQMVACELLQGVGFHVDVAENGQMGVHQVHARHADAQPYDVVLMDLQMPVMDGVTASRLIRETYGADTLPIVAMTANAMQADKERCMAAGMNGFVSKPINPDELWRSLLAWIKPRAGLGLVPRSSLPVHAPSEPLEPVLAALRGIAGLDANRGLSLSNHNTALYVAMLGKFVKYQEHCIDAIRQALVDADTASAERLAHTLKGLSASLGAQPLHLMLAQIEQAVQEGQDIASITRLLEPASAQLKALVAHLRATPGLLADPAPVTQEALTQAQQLEVQAVIQTLRQLLQQDDSEAQALWDSHARELHAVLRQAQELEQAIQGFDFEEALRLMPA